MHKAEIRAELIDPQLINCGWGMIFFLDCN